MVATRFAKRLIRPLVEAGISAVGPHRWPLRRPRLVVLTYHRVLPGTDREWGVEQPGMLVTPETLRMHLETVGGHFDFVHLDDWVRGARAGAPLPRLACAVTFDDGWRDNYVHAFPILRALRVPATVFLVTELVGTDRAFWPNRLTRLLRRWPGREGDAGLPDDLRRSLRALGLPEGCHPSRLTEDEVDAVIAAAKGSSDRVMHELLDELEVRVGPPRDAATDLLDWKQIRAMRDSGLVRFGSHTRHHTRLTPGLASELLADEIAGSHARLEAELGEFSTLFCYPNGDCSEEALAHVRACYDGAVSTATGWNDADSDLYSIRRIGLHEDVSAHPAAFRARLSGWI